MTTNKRIKKALNLKQDTAEIHRYYDEWSADYDQDVTSEHYSGPETIARLASSMLENEDGTPSVDMRSQARVLDAGCGTGLAGVELVKHGFNHLVGIDLSPKMIELAHQTGVYQTLCAEVDLTQPVAAQIAARSDLSLPESDQFDITVCVGVFTLGHVPPSVMYKLLHVTRPGGFVLVTARQEYCDTYQFEDFCSQLEKEGLANVEYAERDDYVSYGRALYAVLRRQR